MHEQRGYSIFTVKAIDERSRSFSGTATTPAPDSDGDIIEPLGVSFDNPAPLLLFHDVKMPVGTVTFKTPTRDGVEFEATIPEVTEPGVIKDRTDMAWHSVKHRLITAVSVRVAAKSEDVKKLATGGMHWLKSQIRELSLVTIPANSEATIAVVKSLDLERDAASGTSPDQTNPLRARSTSRVVHLNPRRVTTMKTIADQLTSYKSTRDAKFQKMTEMATKSADEGVTFDAAQEEEYDTLKGEVASLDKHIARLEDLDKSNIATATAVKGTTEKEGTETRSRSSIQVVHRKLDPGIGFARVAMCVMAAKGIGGEAIRIAAMQYPNDMVLLEAVKTAVGGATTGNNQGPAVQYMDLASEFIGYLRSKTILDKFGNGSVPSLRRVPFNTRVGTQTAGATANWVGEGKPKPLSKGTFGTTTLDFHKIAVICALTKEEVRFGVSSAEQKVRDDMAAAIAAGIDSAFIDPANAGTSGVKPAAITYNVAATAVSGTSAAALRLDLKNMIGTMIAAGIQPNSLVLLMSQGIALSLSLSVNTLGQPDFPGITKDGGSLFGIPVIASEAITTLGSPTANMIVAVNANDVFLADDGAITIDASEQASLQMDDNPQTQDGTTGTGTSLVSLWQTNMLGLRAEREITWKLVRAASVQYLSGVGYVPS